MSNIVHEHFEELLLDVRHPARLIGGEYGAGPGFSGSPGELRVTLGFPDTYEIGISNQALQILYSIALTVPGVGVERTYLPWVDAISSMRRRGIPLLTVESWTRVAETDLLALTIQHEFNYTNMLEILSLAGIPLVAAERSEVDPLLLIGGPACANFLPLARFVDAVAVGDGEDLFGDILQTLASAKAAGASREERRGALAAIEGVYVPGVSRVVKRRVIKRLEGASFPENILVPLTSGVHDRAWVEIMRGCTRGCRFCQAGMWYRPVRERSPAEILRIAQAQVEASGYEEIALASLSTTDYSCLEEVLGQLARRMPEVRVSLPSLRVDSAAVRLAALASPSGSSLTLAPEVGSPRMWGVVNKNVSDAQVLSAVEEAFAGGRTTLKLYFMIGLPLETDEDVEAIAHLCLRMKEVGRRRLGARAGRLQLNLSVNNFVPKPFTPFQWSGMADRETLVRRQERLHRILRKSGVRLVTHDVDRSYLEAALARGDEDLGALIETAWRKGARFDQWTEQFRSDAWREAFAEMGTSAEQLATSCLSKERSLPWEIIEGVADRGFLWKEWEKAQRGEMSGDCRWQGCVACGACSTTCENDLAVDLSPEGKSKSISNFESEGQVAAHLRERTACSRECGARPQESTPRRFVARFSVHGRSRFLSHLDRLEMFRRAVRRAGGRLAFSQGLRPKSRLSLVLPLAVGMESEEELCEFVLEEAPPSDFAERLNAGLPSGTCLIDLVEYSGRGSLAATVTGASYEVLVEVGEEDSAQPRIAEIGSAAEWFEKAFEAVVEEERQGKVRQVDVKKYVDQVTVHPQGNNLALLSFQVRVTPTGTARPEHVVEALSKLGQVSLRLIAVRRTRIHLAASAGDAYSLLAGGS